jgi:hypothetical protein
MPFMDRKADFMTMLLFRALAILLFDMTNGFTGETGIMLREDITRDVIVWETEWNLWISSNND